MTVLPASRHCHPNDAGACVLATRYVIRNCQRRSPRRIVCSGPLPAANGQTGQGQVCSCLPQAPTHCKQCSGCGHHISAVLPHLQHCQVVHCVCADHPRLVRAAAAAVLAAATQDDLDRLHGRQCTQGEQVSRVFLRGGRGGLVPHASGRDRQARKPMATGGGLWPPMRTGSRGNRCTCR